MQKLASGHIQVVSIGRRSAGYGLQNHISEIFLFPRSGSYATLDPTNNQRVNDTDTVVGDPVKLSNDLTCYNIGDGSFNFFKSLTSFVCVLLPSAQNSRLLHNACVGSLQTLKCSKLCMVLLEYCDPYSFYINRR